MPAAFDDVRLPVDIEQGSTVGPMFQTTIVPLSSGSEQRNADWSQEKLSADISYGVMAKKNPRDIADSFAAVMSFYRARMGRWRGFRFRDWSDYQVWDEPLKHIGDNFWQLQIGYEGYDRIISRPDKDTLQFSVGGAWTLLPGGIVVLGAANSGEVTFSCEFDVPMRFDSDIAQVSMLQIEAGQIPSIKLVQCPDPPSVDMQEYIRDHA